MINRYRFIKSSQIAAPTLSDLAKAKEITDFDAILKASQSIGKYEFSEDAKANEFFRTAESLETSSEKGTNGEIFNRAKVMVKGLSYSLRVFGVKNAPVTTKVYTPTEIKTLTFGYCNSDGQKVTTAKVNPATGEVENVPVLYVKLA